MSEKMPSPANPEQEQSSGEQRTDEKNRPLGKKLLDFVRRFHKKQKYETEAEAEPTIILEKTSRLENKLETNLDGLDDAMQLEESLDDSPETQAAKRELIRSFEEWQKTLQSIAEKGAVTPDDDYELKMKRNAITSAQIVYVSTLLPLQDQEDYMSMFFVNPEDEGAEIVDYRKTSFIAPYLMDAANGRLDSKKLQDAIHGNDPVYDYTEQEREEIVEEFEPFFERLTERSKKK